MNTIKSPFKCLCVSVGNLPTSYIESMSYYECLTYFVKFLENEVIPALNQDTEAIKELQNYYTELKQYVDDYFDELNIQSEIDNKLDEMADQGTLTQIISQFLETGCVLVFNTVNDMKSAENLIHGNICKTTGFYQINDGGNATYRIRNKLEGDVIDEVLFISLHDNNLVAELLCNEVNLPSFGCHGNNTNDDTTNLLIAFNYARTHNLKVTSPRNKKYILNNTIDISNMTIDLNDSTIKTTSAINMFQIDEEDPYSYGHYQNMIIDCNDIALIGINIITSRRTKFNNINIINVKNIGIDIKAGYEIMFDLINLQSSNESNTSSIGFRVQTRDCNFTNITATNICTPFYLKACNGNFFNKIHTWIGRSSLIPYSAMFVIDLVYPEILILNEIYDDTMRYFIKYETGSAYILNGYINNLIVEYNTSIYQKDTANSVLFLCENAEQTRHIKIFDSNINGLYYIPHANTDASTYLTNLDDFYGDIEQSFYSAIHYSDIKELIEVNENITLLTNAVYKSNKTVELDIVGRYESDETSGNINIAKIPNYLLPKTSITCSSMVTDSRYDWTTPNLYYTYIPIIDSGEYIQMKLPSGASTKYFFIQLSYNRD